MTIIQNLFRDARYAIRLVANAPGFTVAAVTMIALAIGANTAIYSVIDTVLIEPLPYATPDRLVILWNAADRRGTTHLSLREIVGYGDEVNSFALMAGYVETNANLSGDEEPERVRAAFVTTSTFATLGVGPVAGRSFAADEGRPGGADVVMLSEGLWQRRFGGARDVVGRSLRVNGRPRIVVGIMPESFRLPLDYRTERPTEVWLPLVVDRANLGAWGDRSYFGIARLRDGASAAEATAAIGVVTERWIQQGFEGFRGGVIRRDAVPVHDLITGAARRPLLILLGAVAALLLIACANVVNLLLARADVRRREMAIRAAMGAGRAQLARQLLVEAALLAFVGAAGGLAVAHATLRLLVALAPANVPRLSDVALDPGVLTVTGLLAVLTALLFGVLPASQTVRPRLAGLLNDGGRGGTPGRARRRARGALVVLQLALSVVLVIGAGLLVRTLAAMSRIDLGFDPRHVLTAQLQLPQTDYPDERVVPFYRELTERLRQLPGVLDAGAVRILPLARTIGNYSITIDGRPTRPDENPNGDFQWVTPGYFRVMRPTLLRGRLLTDADREDAPLVVVINDTMAERYWPGQEAIGRRFHMGGGTSRPPLTIVGIVRGTRHNAYIEAARAEMYLPHAQLPRSVGGAARGMTLVVRTAGDPLLMRDPVAAIVRAMDRNLPLADIRTMEQVTAAALSTPRFSAMLLGVFAVVALTLAAIGTYATVSLLVAERSQEIGIRMALGAARRSVVSLVFREGLMLAGLGIAAGMSAAFIASRSLETLLYGVSRFDPATFATVPAVLVAVALAACVYPARRAAAVDPAVTLRRG